MCLIGENGCHLVIARFWMLILALRYVKHPWQRAGQLILELGKLKVCYVGGTSALLCTPCYQATAGKNCNQTY
jgi:hypothetical protein